MTTRLVAHRGDNRHYPENTLIALKAALEAGAHYVECDIQLDADLTPVVLHDTSFLRTAGNDKIIFECRDNQVRSFSVHEPERFGKTYFPTPVPFLTDVLALLQHYPKVTAFIEIKEESLERFGLDSVVKAVLQAIPEFSQSIVLISFSYAAIETIKLNSRLPTGWVIRQYDDDAHVKATRLKPEYLFCNHEKLPDDTLWQGDWQWAVYTINESELALEWLTRGIDLVETDAFLDLSVKPAG